MNRILPLKRLNSRILLNAKALKARLSRILSRFEGKYEKEIRDELVEFSEEQKREILIFRLIKALHKRHDELLKFNFSFEILKDGETQETDKKVYGKSLRGKIVYKEYSEFREAELSFLGKKVKNNV